MSDNTGARIRLTGRVQMVGFRWFARQWAEDLQLTGWVRNNRDGSVEIEVEGKQKRIDEFFEEMRKGPKQATVDSASPEPLPFENRFRSFEIRY